MEEDWVECKNCKHIYHKAKKWGALPVLCMTPSKGKIKCGFFEQK